MQINSYSIVKDMEQIYWMATKTKVGTTILIIQISTVYSKYSNSTRKA